ncbi:cytosolic phospholipase A2 [Pelomyxa schiedti]|nr:cytosolic phospholipase A2 [Pelomyxa schiedti]
MSQGAAPSLSIKSSLEHSIEAEQRAAVARSRITEAAIINLLRRHDADSLKRRFKPPTVPPQTTPAVAVNCGAACETRDSAAPASALTNTAATNGHSAASDSVGTTTTLTREHEEHDALMDSSGIVFSSGDNDCGGAPPNDPLEDEKDAISSEGPRCVTGHVAICSSGGGVRSLTATVGFMDGLCETGILDCVEYCAGLSGSTWCFSQWLTDPLCGNPFHGDTDPWACTTEPLSGASPLSLPEPPMDATNPTNLPAVPYVSPPSQHRINDKGTIPHALTLSTHLGLKQQLEQTSPERPFSLFLVGLGLDWKQVTQALWQGLKSRDSAAVNAWASILASQLMQKRCEIAGIPSPRDILFSSCAEKCNTGKFPIPICTTICSRNGDGNREWVDISPFIVRKSRVPVCSTKNLALDPIPILMAVCGSAFAIDLKTKIPPLGYATLESMEERLPYCIQKYVHPLLQQHFPAHGVWHESLVGDLRDAGLDCNIPLPALQQRTSADGRGVSLILVLDSSRKTLGCEQLAKAVDKGYFRISEADRDKLRAPFGPTEGVRFFRPARMGDPAVLYFRGYTLLRTITLAFTSEQVDAMTSHVRQLVVNNAQTIAWAIKKYCTTPCSKVLPLLKNVVECTNMREIVRRKLSLFYKEKFTTMSFFDNNIDPRNFASVFCKMLLTPESKNDTGMPEKETSHKVDIEQLPALLLASRKKRCILEAAVGSGKSTICKFLCREQGNDTSSFAAIVLIELQSVEPEALSADNFDVFKFITEKLGIRDEQVTTFIQNYCSEVLWVFDSFDEVDSNPHFSKFLQHLRDGNVRWAQWAIIASRMERRHSHFVNAMCIKVQPWSEDNAVEYIEKFFGNMESSGEGPPELGKQKAKKILRNIPIGDKTPLICELVCTIAHKLPADSTSKLSLLSNITDYLWERAMIKFGNEFSLEAVHQAQERLLDLSSEAYCASDGRIALDVSQSIDGLVFRSGLLCQFGSSDNNPSNNKKWCRFVHRMLLEYHTAKAVERDFQELEKTLPQQVVPGQQSLRKSAPGIPLKASRPTLFEKCIKRLSPDNYELLRLISEFVQNTNHWEVVFSFAVNKFLGKLQRKKAQFELDMSMCGDNLLTREYWCSKLRLDICVLMATIIGGKAGTYFVNAVTVPESTIGSIGKLFSAKKSPVFYQLMVEPSARYGNIFLLRHFIECGGKNQIKDALFIAFVANQGHVVEWLHSTYSGLHTVSVADAAHIGNTEAVISLIKAQPPGVSVTNAVIQATNAAVESDRQLVLKRLHECNLITPKDLAPFICKSWKLHKMCKCFHFLSRLVCTDLLQLDWTTFGVVSWLGVETEMLRAFSEFIDGKLLTKIDLGCLKVEDITLTSLIQKCSSLLTLEVHSPKVTDKSLYVLAKSCCNLSCLNLAYCNVSDSGVISVLKSCIFLTSLNLNMTQTSAKAVLAIAQSDTKFTTLSLNNGASAQHVLQFVEKHPDLTSLEISGPSISDAETLTSLQCFPALATLGLYQVEGVGQEWMLQLTQLCYLQSLSVWGAVLTDSVFSVLLRMPALKSLKLHKVELLGTGTRDFLKPPFCSLHSLELWCSNISSTGISGILQLIQTRANQSPTTNTETVTFEGVPYPIQTPCSDVLIFVTTPCPPKWRDLHRRNIIRFCGKS